MNRTAGGTIGNEREQGMMPLIKCTHVDFGYDNQDAVVDVNLEVDAGDYICIVGRMAREKVLSLRDCWDC